MATALFTGIPRTMRLINSSRLISSIRTVVPLGRPLGLALFFTTAVVTLALSFLPWVYSTLLTTRAVVVRSNVFNGSFKLFSAMVTIDSIFIRLAL
jgi:hypothetical protein